jgi:hypothetical protein
MRTFTKTIVAVAILAAAAAVNFPGTGAANAQGFYLNAPGIHIGVGERHHQRDYRAYRRGYSAYAADRGHPYGYNYDYGDPRCGRPNFTIQDGVCKPYTGR